MGDVMKKLKQNKKGFTLLEILIAMAISSLLLTGLVGMLLPANDMLHKTSCLQEQREIIRTVNYGISERVRYASDVIIINNTSAMPVKTSATLPEYKVLKIDKTVGDYRGSVISGRVYVADSLGSDIKPMISLDSYVRYSCDIEVSKDNANLVLDFHLYRNMKNGTVEDSFTVVNKTLLKNCTDAVEDKGSFRIIDVKTMTDAQKIPGLSIKPVGDDTYILYK